MKETKQTFIRVSPEGTRFRFFRYQAMFDQIVVTYGWAAMPPGVNNREPASLADAVMFGGKVVARHTWQRDEDTKQEAQRRLDRWRQRQERFEGYKEEIKLEGV